MIPAPAWMSAPSGEGRFRGALVLLDDVRSGLMRLFTNPAWIVTVHEAEEVEDALKTISRLVNDGFHAAGYLSYELGYALEQRLLPLMPAKRHVPLLWFGMFRTFEEIAGAAVPTWFDSHIVGRAYAGPLTFAESAESYTARFRVVQDYIRAGDIYQANLTFPARFSFVGDELALYRRLREQAGASHCAFVFDGRRSILSLSPELFFSLKDELVTSRPMKGTAPRGIGGTDDARMRNALASSAKDRAENLMIVDLIRNDLGRVAKTGSVRVDELFSVETYPTVHQMVSTVSAALRDGTTAADLLPAIFPCGSVTGAPKIRAMEIIRECEPEPRGVYCGAIGCFSPGGIADFNVAIRTLTITNDAGELAVGSGVVADSRAADEFEECILKARYYIADRPALSLIETLSFEPKTGFLRVELHLRRMSRSAAQFGIAFDPAEAREALRAAVEKHTGPARIRLELNGDGSFEIAILPPPTPERTWTYAIAARTVQSGDALSRHKTSWRTLFEEEFARLHGVTGCDQVVFLNERNEVVEGNTTNVFVRSDGKLLTPPLCSGALDGVLRRYLLESGECREAVLHLDDLLSGEVYLGNSVRGLIRAVPSASQPRERF